MQTNLTDMLIVPFVKILKESGKDEVKCNEFIGKYYAYREVFRLGYNILEPEHKLEKMTQDAKETLWNNSLKYCSKDRLNWCKAVHFYNLVK
jgi:hypothetical protein